MTTNDLTNGIIRACFRLALIIFALWLLLLLKKLFLYLGVAVVVTLIGRPINRILRLKLRFNNLFATIVTIGLLLSITFGISALFVPLLAEQGENLSLLDVGSLENKIAIIINKISTQFNVADIFGENLFSVEQLLENIDFDLVSRFLNEVIGLLGSFTVGLFSVIFISFFLLKDSQLLEQIIFTLIKTKYETRAKKSLNKIKALLSRYFLGLCLQIGILFLFYSAMLYIFGVQNAFIIAFLCALLNLIPYLGPIIGGLLMFVLTLTSFIEIGLEGPVLPKTLYVMIGFALGQLIDNFFSQPYIFSSSVKSHPLEIFIVILACGTLMGTLGMVVAIPFYTMLKVVVKEFFSQYKIVKALSKGF